MDAKIIPKKKIKKRREKKKAIACGTWAQK